MSADRVLGLAALVFAVAALVRMARAGCVDARARTWLLVAALFAAVAAWQWHTS